QFLVARDTPRVSVHALEGFDITRRQCEVRFEDVEVARDARVGERGTSSKTVDRQLEYAALLIAADSVGAMDRIFSLTVGYAKVRTAFGRPIGSFQAVKHLLADTSLLLEESKAIAVGAAHALQDDAPDASELASVAKAFVGDAGIELAHNCWQVFGGI